MEDSVQLLMDTVAIGEMFARTLRLQTRHDVPVRYYREKWVAPSVAVRYYREKWVAPSVAFIIIYCLCKSVKGVLEKKGLIRPKGAPEVFKAWLKRPMIICASCRWT